MKKLVKRSDVMQETLEAYCSCSCSCYGTCSCSTGQTNNSAALFQARYTLHGLCSNSYGVRT